MSALLRVLLVDDQPLVRAGLQRLLSPADGFAIAGECSDGAAALEALTAPGAQVDVVCMDVRMRGMDGIEATRRIGELDDPPPVLVLTTFDDDEILWGAVEAGAAGFILKEASAEDLIRATRCVALGGPGSTPRSRLACSTPTAARERPGSAAAPSSTGSRCASGRCWSTWPPAPPMRRSPRRCS